MCSTCFSNYTYVQAILTMSGNCFWNGHGKKTHCFSASRNRTTCLRLYVIRYNFHCNVVIETSRNALKSWNYNPCNSLQPVPATAVILVENRHYFTIHTRSANSNECPPARARRPITGNTILNRIAHVAING